MKRSLRNSLLFFALATATAGLSSCGKQVEFLGKVKTIQAPKGPKCGFDYDRLTWQWIQPLPSDTKAVDLLFVTDTSLSLFSERHTLSRALPHFLAGLPADADTRVAVMLGHGGRGRWSGRLFSRRWEDRVINPQQLGIKRATEILEDSLACPPLELASTNGEALMLSLSKSLKGSRFNEIRSQGFFRDGAALSVVFVSDENDVCFDPTEHGYQSYPDYKPSVLGLEERARRKYCNNLTPRSLLAELESTFPGRKISMGSVIHTDPAHVRKWGEDAIGHGFLQLMAMVPDGFSMDVKTGDFDAGLGRLATVSTSQLSLLTSFQLVTSAKLDPNSVMVWVDGVPVASTFDEASSTVRIDGKDAGIARSQVDVSACPMPDDVPPPPVVR